MADFDAVSAAFKVVHDHISSWLVGAADGQPYHEDIWEYSKGQGGGVTRVWEGYSRDVIEKAGVNYSSISGSSLPQSSTAAKSTPSSEPVGFRATGVSLVIHPSNPMVPTIHMNIRYLERSDGKWWFGGGVDLTPYYPNFQESKDFHLFLNDLCTGHRRPYAEYKQECDTYFTIKHRKEMRGIGGIFFDNLSDDRTAILDFVVELGRSFPELYGPILEANKHKAYNLTQREYQLWRRSRYVEFNLLWDRGTKFGIESEGRAESILMSLPSTCKWRYNYIPTNGTSEFVTHSFYLHPQDWINLTLDQVPAITSQYSDFETVASHAFDLQNMGYQSRYQLLNPNMEIFGIHNLVIAAVGVIIGAIGAAAIIKRR